MTFDLLPTELRADRDHLRDDGVSDAALRHIADTILRQLGSYRNRAQVEAGDEADREQMTGQLLELIGAWPQLKALLARDKGDDG